ncbi:N-acetyldiaminopimelate deacetylase [Pediococcus claussenii]|uniref:N-acetyldiaminopimelate deacetylase n=1 Tax=Pediococcus claussenii (strain ATCC BAA-344 / DSM 14800 / JCM 18046 / KCTC 3811 / LMG 21948 / P06) TaxID=701521 RepID=G8PEU3_PEDCP|nr:N-acetyldiaminopimelate deacetylase [Pediococcus claussenii]AEV94473.1 amidohydrolase family protein [Pediococcus claussenii ATCC BAA-344]ANZ69692.1 N-acetyldiaminopimelate deacetylase [Pediococcus claussenii]ANZ71509.1 N-acetyldiaminopimelate deacetylase [Pediococcus claussenii]KRN19819.1 hypothetical protein IV79_GL001108 [Pediococcus claussenii]
MLNESDLISIRREFHQIPELALHEFETHRLLEKKIKKMPQQFLTIREIGELPTALLVKIGGSHPKRNIGYRADIDALPVSEQTDTDFRSKHEGVMHACGHDLHMTVALGLLDYFANHQPIDNLIFFFQPAEESDNGGKFAYELGIFNGEWNVDEFYGLHDNPDLPSGAIGCRNGTLFAGTTEVNITLTGKSGHAAYPQNSNDMVVAAAYLITQLQTIVSRNVDPIEGGVLTLGKITAGTIRNVIAGTARIEGTIRGLTQKMILHIQKRVREVCIGISLSFDCDVNVELNQGGYLPVENDPTLTTNFISYMQNANNVQFIKTEPAMTGEDFGYLLSKIPGTMFWLGVDSLAPLHSDLFDPNESAIWTGIQAITGFLNERMTQNV